MRGAGRTGRHVAVVAVVLVTLLGAHLPAGAAEAPATLFAGDIGEHLYDPALVEDAFEAGVLLARMGPSEAPLSMESDQQLATRLMEAMRQDGVPAFQQHLLESIDFVAAPIPITGTEEVVAPVQILNSLTQSQQFKDWVARLRTVVSSETYASALVSGDPEAMALAGIIDRLEDAAEAIGRGVGRVIEGGARIVTGAGLVVAGAVVAVGALIGAALTTASAVTACPLSGPAYAFCVVAVASAAVVGAVLVIQQGAVPIILLGAGQVVAGATDIAAAANHFAEAVGYVILGAQEEAQAIYDQIQFLFCIIERPFDPTCYPASPVPVP